MNPRRKKGRLSYTAVIFDLDGVVTKTAVAHAVSWKQMFDEYLRLREQRDGEPFKEFTIEEDYRHYVDGKPRYKGVQSFLESRGISLPLGGSGDAPEEETICGLGNNKNVKFAEILKTKGIEVYPSTVVLVKALKAQGIRVGVASSSKNCPFVLQSAGIEDLFETKVDGIVSAQLGLKGKPEGDIFIMAAQTIGVEPAESVVVEDAVSGVQAGVHGGFGLVIGVAREDNAKALKNSGADIVINDFEGITPETIEQWFKRKKSR